MTRTRQTTCLAACGTATEAGAPCNPAYRKNDIKVCELVAGDVATDQPTDQPAEEIRFGLWDDGTLTIIDGDNVIEIDAAAIKRLALLLGVPREVQS